MGYQEINESGERAEALYKRLRSKVETHVNIGKMLVINVDSEDYEIAGTGIMICQNHTQLFRFQVRCGTIKYAL